MKRLFRFYFITDDSESAPPVEKQVEIAVSAGATIIQYRNKRFATADFNRVLGLRNFCATNRVPFIINDDILLARAVGADGVHLGQGDSSPALARQILEDHAIIGISVSTPDELTRTDTASCDYIGTGPVYSTATKADAKPVIGVAGLAAVVDKSPLPVVAIGGIGPDNAADCISAGAAGVAVISAITRSVDPAKSARKLAAICGCAPRDPQPPWDDEFSLIDDLLRVCGPVNQASIGVKVAAGDDAALFCGLKYPVFTTDTQREGVHFQTRWQSPAEIGRKAVEITFSDLAASYARPVGLFVNLTLPAAFAKSDGETLYSGIDAALKTHGGALGGGNISSGDRLALDLFAVGEGSAIFPRRRTANPGDGLYVTGPLGLARAGLHCLKRGDEGYPELVARFKCPAARFDAARILAEEGVLCVTDLSDGLAGDAAHIAVASGLSIRFEPEAFVISPALEKFCRTYRLDPATEILSGGEDYELLFACPPPVFERIARRLPGAHRVGGCILFSEDHLVDLPAAIGSYRHGRRWKEGR